MARQDDGDNSGISIGIPKQFVAYVVGAALVGGMGINTALFKTSTSNERDDLLRIVAAFGEQVNANAARITAVDAKAEAFRTDLYRWSVATVSQEDISAIIREQERKHDTLDKTDIQFARAIAALERQLDDFQKGRR